MSRQLPITDVIVDQGNAAVGCSPDARQGLGVSSVFECQISFAQDAPLRIALDNLGTEAADILYHHTQGEVLAVFARSFYIQFDQRILCVGVASLGRGPLHVLLACAHDVLPFKVVRGVSVGIQGNWQQRLGCVSLGSDGSIGENPPRFYSGKLQGRALFSRTNQRAKDALKLIVPPSQSGFAWMFSNVDWQRQGSKLIESSTGISLFDTSLVKHSLPGLLCLFRWLACARQSRGIGRQSDLTAAISLLGAGSGLTPSGDDLLAGIMLALYRVQRADMAGLLWQVLEPQLQQRTHGISGAHLRMAASGQCAEPVLLLIESIFNEHGYSEGADARSLATIIQSQADAIGGSSGWDLLAGMAMVLRS